MRVAAAWGEDPLPFARLMAPSQQDNQSYLRWANRMNRLSASPADFMRQLENIVGIIGTTQPSQVEAPTVVVHLIGDRCVPIGNGRALAELIPHARLVEVQGADHLMYSLDNRREIVDPVIEFFTGVKPPLSIQRRFAVVMFTDIAGLTTLSSSMGDVRYKEVIETHDLTDRGTRRPKHLRLGGQPGSPRRSRRNRRINLRLVDDEGDAVGGDTDLENRGEHTLKGIEGSWTLYEVC